MTDSLKPTDDARARALLELIDTSVEVGHPRGVIDAANYEKMRLKLALAALGERAR